MKRSYLISMSLLCAAALTATSAVSAGPENDEMKRSNQSKDQMSMKNRQHQHSDKTQRTITQYNLQPESRISVAADYDNDGQFDAIETIYYYDFVNAQNASRQSSGKSGKQSSGKNAMQKHSQNQGQKMSRDSQNSEASQQQTTKLTGNIKDLRRVQLADSDKDFVVARIDTDQGQSATALLGSNSQLSGLNLSKGDRVTVQGHRGHINDKSMLIANKVSAANRSVSIDVPSSRHLKRAQGEVMSKRTVNFRGFDEKFVVAEVELRNGKRETVNLGPHSKVQKLDLEEGDNIKLLVRPGTVGGESAMIAEQIQANGEMVNLPRPQDTERFQRQQS